jgi:hypothetical protein
MEEKIPLQNEDKPIISNNDDSKATVFEIELYHLINKHVKDGLSKFDLVAKMKYVLKSCEMS